MRSIQTLLMNKFTGLVRYFSSFVNSVISTSPNLGYALKFLGLMISRKLGMLLSIGFYLILETVVVRVILLNTRQHRRAE